jgi:hypothetical protein
MFRLSRVITLSLVLLSTAASSRLVAQTLSSSNLPIIIIETNGAYIQDEPKIAAHMGVIYNGEGARNNATDPFNGYDGYIGIERRGSSSQSFPKHQYSVELWTESGADTSHSLLQLPAEEDWVLFAPYNDKSLMRDVLAYKMGSDLGRYAPRTKYFELVLNGEYLGIYVLIEKIKRDSNRLDISKLDPEENSGDDVTGGYILKIDKFSGNGGSGFESEYAAPNSQQNLKTFFQYEYPEPAEITFEQQNYIRQYVRNFENVLYGSNYDDPQQGYRAYADVQSFVDFMIMNEVTKNVDGYRLSTYFHKDKNSKGGKLSMGPIWDFNLGFGNADYCTSGDAYGFVYNFNSICPGDFWLVPFWWKRMHQDSYFRRALIARWKELRTGKFQTSVVHAYIDSVANVLNEESQQRNFTRWPVLGQWVWPNYYVGPTFDSEVQYLKQWVETRMEWLDGQWDDDLVTANEEELDAGLVIYPNPSGRNWTLEMSSESIGEFHLELLDIRGSRALSREVNASSGKIFENISGESLAEGVYILRIIRADKAPIVRKLIRTR